MLNHRDIAIAKGMLRRGDNIDDVASFLGTNRQDVELVKIGERGDWIMPAPRHKLPGQGARIFSREKAKQIRVALQDMETIETLRALQSIIDVMIRELETAPETGEVFDRQ
jgi:hypothetical protein